MPVTLQCVHFPLSVREVHKLWRATVAFRQHRDDTVTVRCVTVEKIRGLNLKYRGNDEQTNVLTFTYQPPGVWEEGKERQHDIALCLVVARREALQRGIARYDYVAHLLVHAFLHATGMDHERSAAAAQRQRTAEKYILSQAGFRVSRL